METTLTRAAPATNGSLAAPVVITVNDLEDLLSDWESSLKVRQLSPRTLDAYLTAARDLVTYLRDQQITVLTRRTLVNYFAHMSERKPKTGSKAVSLSANTRANAYRRLQQYFNWLKREGVIETSPLEGTPAPKVQDQPVPIVTEDEFTRLLATFDGDKSFEARRDLLVVHALYYSGMRVSELVGITLDDINREHLAFWVLGKGGRHRPVPFNEATNEALGRYLRMRKEHKLANRTGQLLLGKDGPTTPSGVQQMLGARGNRAGITKLHPHKFRHTFAHTWLDSGEQEKTLMSIMGWTSRKMLDRYAASVATDRALDAYRRRDRDSYSNGMLTSRRSGA